jgi:ubiquinol-cytochrome c reductase cytochrome b subunit
VVILHVWALHTTGPTTRLGVEVKSAGHAAVHPVYTVKDAFALCIFFMMFAAFVFYAPTIWATRQLHRGEPAGDAGAHRA